MFATMFSSVISNPGFTADTLPGDDCRAEFYYYEITHPYIYTARTFRFRDSSFAYNFENFLWEFGDGTEYVLQNPYHRCSQSGTYVVNLRTGTSSGCYSNINIGVRVGSYILNTKSSFTYFEIEDSLSDYKTFQFENTSQGVTESYSWFFNSDDYSYENHPGYSFYIEDVPLEHEVCLIAFDVHGYSDTSCQYITVDGNISENCKADFRYYEITDTMMVGGRNYQFTDYSLGNDIYYWQWSFGDGSYSNEQNPTHSYGIFPDSPDTYEVWLLIASRNGCVDSVYYKVNLIDTISDYCRAEFQFYSAYNGNLKYRIFENTSVSFSEIISSYWNFGDGETSYEISPSHTFQSSGSYTICLTIMSEDSCMDTYCDSIFVQNNSGCEADFRYKIDSLYKDDTLTTEPIPVQFYDNSSSGFVIMDYHWDFGDGTEIYSQAPHHDLPLDADILQSGAYHFNYVQPGNYIIYAIPSLGYSDGYIPTYFVNKISWRNADILTVNNNLSDLDIQLKKINRITGGSCKIKGKVVFDISDELSDRFIFNGLKSTRSGTVEVPVILTSPDGTVLDYSFADTSGYFEFDELLYGEYTVFPELPNLYSANKFKITLDIENPIADNIDFNINNGNVTAISNNNYLNPGTKLWYNYNSNELVLNTNFNKSTNAKVEIYNYMGQLINSRKVNINPGNNLLKIDPDITGTKIYIAKVIFATGKTTKIKFINSPK